MHITKLSIMYSRARQLMVLAAFLATPHLAQAGPISFVAFSDYHASEYINSPADNANQVDASISRQIELGIAIEDDGNILGDEVTVTAVNSNASSTTYTLRTFGGPVFSPGHFLELDYDQALADGSWTITATRGTETITTTVGAHNPATIINPFDPNSVTLTENGLNPILSWALPGLTGPGSDYDLLAVQVVDPTVPWSDEGNIFFQDILNTDTTSYTFADGILESGNDYILRVRTAYWDAENNFANFTTGSTYSTFGVNYTTVPEPATSWLMFTTLGFLAWGRRRARA